MAKKRTDSKRKNPASQSKEKSLHVWFVLFSLYLSQILLHTHTHTHSEQCFVFFASVDCLHFHKMNKSGDVPNNVEFFQVNQSAATLQRLAGNPSLGYVWNEVIPGKRATDSVESTVRVYDCHWHWVKVVHSHVCKETTVGVKLGSC